MIFTTNQRRPVRLRKRARRCILAAITLAAWAFAHVSAVAADAGAGKVKAEGCVGCHGENGVSEIESTPSLAGQPDAFIQWQLVFFRSGARKNEVMSPIARSSAMRTFATSAPILLRSSLPTTLKTRGRMTTSLN